MHPLMKLLEVDRIFVMELFEFTANSLDARLTCMRLYVRTKRHPESTGMISWVISANLI